MEKRNIYLLALLFTCIAIIASVISSHYFPTSWDALRQATCMPNNCFNEAISSGNIRQPINAWSSLAFVFAGFIIFFESVRIPNNSNRDSNVMVKYPIFGIFYGMILIYIGLTSAFYHATLTFLGQTLDVLGMYLLATYLVLYGLARILKLGVSSIILSYVLSNAILIYFLITAPQYRRYIFALLIIITLVLELYGHRQAKLSRQTNYLILAVILFGISFIIWNLDMSKNIFSENSLFQGHAIWHIGGAISATLLYYYYRSECLRTA